jgi:hypothetical protein
MPRLGEAVRKYLGEACCSRLGGGTLTVTLVTLLLGAGIPTVTLAPRIGDTARPCKATGDGKHIGATAVAMGAIICTGAAFVCTLPPCGVGAAPLLLPEGVAEGLFAAMESTMAF